MVQVDISQLSQECNHWRDKLRMYRSELNQNESQLRQAASQSLTRSQLEEVEHLHNQFHIQLINIHDLKQGIKVHDRKMSFEKNAFNGSANEDSFNLHEILMRDYERLETRLQELRDEFDRFLSRTK